MEKIYEGSSVAVKAAMSKEHAKKLKSLTFRFLQDGEPPKQDALSGDSVFEKKYSAADVGNGLPEDAVEGSEVIVHRIHAPGVPGDKDAYVLNYHIFYEVEAAGGKIVKNQDLSVKQFQVFPRTAQLKATWDKDGKPFPGFQFKVMQGGAQVGEVKHTFANDTVNVKGETIPAGSAEFNLEMIPGYGIVQVSPWEIVAPVPDDKEKRKYAIKGDLKFRAAFTNPPAGRQRQYVNSDPENQGQDGVGHEVVVEVNDGSGGAGGSDKREVHFRATFGPEAGGAVAKSKRKDADFPTKVDKADKADKVIIEEKKAGESYQGKIELVNGAGRIKLCLGRAGGDTCKFEIAGSDKFLTDKKIEADQVLEIENWRRVHYELMVPDSLYEAALDPESLDLRRDFQQGLESLGRQVFVEFEHAETRVFDMLGSADHGALGPKRFFGLPGGPDEPAYILSGRNWRQPPRGQAWSVDHPAKTLFISLCDLILKWKKDTADESAGPKDFSGTLTAVSGEIDAKERFQGLFMPFSGFDGGAGITDVTWTADITKEDAVCKINPSLTLEESRYDFVETDSLSVEIFCGPAFGLPRELDFRRGADGKFPGSLSAEQTAHIHSYVGAVLKNRNGLGETGGKVKAELTCPKGGGKGEDACVSAVKKTFQEAFDKGKKETASHPGLDADGKPRTGTCPLADVTDMQASSSERWHFLLPETMKDGSIGPGSFVGPAKTKEKCPVKFEFSFQPHEASLGESEGKLLAWACSAAGSQANLVRLVLRSFESETDKAGMVHGHGDEGKAGDCFGKADALCEKCLDYGRAASLAAI